MNDLVFPMIKMQVNLYNFRVNRKFKKCMEPITKSCPEGRNMVYEFDGGFRTNLMKLDYICKDSIRDGMLYHC